MFQRVGADLAMNWTLSLKEALCGYSIKIPHLSRAILHLKSKPGEITQSGQLKCVYGQGISHLKINAIFSIFVSCLIFCDKAFIFGDFLKVLKENYK